MPTGHRPVASGGHGTKARHHVSRGLRSCTPQVSIYRKKTVSYNRSRSDHEDAGNEESYRMKMNESALFAALGLFFWS